MSPSYDPERHGRFAHDDPRARRGAGWGAPTPDEDDRDFGPSERQRWIGERWSSESQRGRAGYGDERDEREAEPPPERDRSRSGVRRSGSSSMLGQAGGGYGGPSFGPSYGSSFGGSSGFRRSYPSSGERSGGGGEHLYADDRPYGGPTSGSWSHTWPTTEGRGYAGGSISHQGKGPKNYQRSDSRIQEDVCDRLTDDPMVDASGIECSVKDGEVTLSGTVGSREEKRRAEDLAESITGVKDVNNQIRVSRSSQPTGGDSSSSSQGSGGSAAAGRGSR